MATLDSLASDVYTITNRPDLVAETKLAIKQATLKMHQMDDFPKDIFETGISWNPTGFTQSLDYKRIIPNWRKFIYLRKYADGAPGDFFKLLTPAEVIDRYGVQKDDICYVAGAYLEIRSSTEDTYMLLGCHVNPNITDNGYSSWIADEHPYAIIMEAAASVFRFVGQMEESQAMRQQVAEQIAIIRQNQILG